MSKNPFVNCKSRKRRKHKYVNPIPKEDRPYCPRTMVRYDNTNTCYSTVWTCKMCMKVVLSEQAVPIHIEECKKNFTRVIEPEIKNDSLEDSKYICHVCDRVFSRKVALKQHQEIHITKLPSDIEESDFEFSSVEVAGLLFPSPVTKKPSPVTKKPSPVAKLPPHVAELPLSVSEMPLPVAELPLPVTELPLPVTELPLPVSERQLPVAELPLTPAAEPLLTPVAELPLTTVVEPLLPPVAESSLNPVAEPPLPPIAEGSQELQSDSQFESTKSDAMAVDG